MSSDSLYVRPVARASRANADSARLQSVAVAFYEASAVAATRLRGVLSDLGLSETAAAVLWMLDPDAAPKSMRDLARVLGCDPSNVSLLGDKLERSGLAVREVSPHDSRARVLTLTDAGSQLRHRLLDGLTAVSPVAALSPADQADLHRLLSKLGDCSAG